MKSPRLKNRVWTQFLKHTFQYKVSLGWMFTSYFHTNYNEKYTFHSLESSDWMFFKKIIKNNE